MSRKSFIIWGLVIIHLYVALVSIAAYLTLSRVIDLKVVGPYIGLIQLLLTIVGFGTILFLRLKTIGRRKWTLAACLPFYFFSIVSASFLVGPVLEMINFFDQGLMPVVNAAAEDQNITKWMKLRFVLILLPAHYLSHWGLFALLAFGSLDPRTPSKSRVVQFLKTGPQRKVALNSATTTARPQEIMA